MDSELLKERWQLAAERIREIPGERETREPFRDYFSWMAVWISGRIEDWKAIEKGVYWERPLEELQRENRIWYEDLLGDNYETSWGNPAYAEERLGEYGKLLSFLYTEVRGLSAFVCEQRLWDCVVVCELFLQIYGAFCGEEIPSAEEIREIIYWYASDYSEEMAARRVREQVDPSLSFATDLIREADLTDLRYLYRFGEYISENELETARFLSGLSEEEIRQMAATYTEGYRKGFVNSGIDLSRKKTVNIRYPLGFERMIRAAVLQFEQMGLSPVIYRAAQHSVNKRQHIRIGYTVSGPNLQYEYDHRNDSGLYLDEDFVSRKLRGLQQAYEEVKDLARTHAGPAVVEVFGGAPFAPEAKPSCCGLTRRQQQLQVHYQNEAGQITNRYIPGDERSFTIISYPLPEIGENYREIFRETVKINTLDSEKYEKIQQKLIDALDQGTSVHILGGNGNRTDLTVRLHSLKDCSRETIFENCVADVNIPVGEVFTSPVLSGTCGLLHVTGVYLNELFYRDLQIRLEDGRVQDYSCANFPKEEDNKAYIRENVLYHHEQLPLGEFAIGTNTAAYVMAQKYKIQSRLPILIAEKTGPHFALGDTCYSWAEDTPVYNRDGKEVIARDNEVSLQRRKDVSKAYFGCHTDITIPYEELALIRVERPDGTGIDLIRDGRFVLPGTEELNQVFG